MVDEQDKPSIGSTERFKEILDALLKDFDGGIDTAMVTASNILVAEVLADTRDCLNHNAGYLAGHAATIAEAIKNWEPPKRFPVQR
jgi:hypothetical protein